MKVLLIAPYINLQYDRSIDHVNREDFYPSAALIHLAAILRANNFEVCILDFNNSEVHSKNEKYLEFSKEEITKSLNEFKPDAVFVDRQAHVCVNTIAENFPVSNEISTLSNAVTSVSPLP